MGCDEPQKPFSVAPELALRKKGGRDPAPPEGFFLQDRGVAGRRARADIEHHSVRVNRVNGDHRGGRLRAELPGDDRVDREEDLFPAGLDQAVRHFYEHTACWRMEAWAQWSALFWPGGELVSRLFGRRVQQLALPTRPLDVAHGMDSRVVHLMDANGEQYAAGWLRTLSATGEFVYSGCYSARLLPASDQPSVHVAFPLESGNVQVFLRPSVQADGSLVLSYHLPFPGIGRIGNNGGWDAISA